MADDRDDGTAELVRRHLLDPIEESNLATRIPRLTEMTDPVSVAVRSQYGEQPYPRWRTAPARRQGSFGGVVAGALGNPDLAATLHVEAPRILVAGCGTGRHAVGAAGRYEGAQVLAIDLSVRSLAYGALRAQRLGISNVEFAQADILGLGELGLEFDVVECVGVLHHLADPEAGWAILRRLTRPGGLMKIGLYSRRGRAFLDPISRMIDERGLEPTVEGIRTVREFVAELPVDTPARGVMAAPDFYSRSGCRDLFFSEHEDRFDLPRIRRAIDLLQLEFLGFELASPRIRALYLRQFPDDPTGRDLSNWDLLERRHPGMFSTMYRFWTRAVD
ncbi:MAG: methyltransferase domain-containing protein [Acidimicrobiia bacterium]|nr:methyltransferase domain-containing protein [Acidimicrobiia bacterium]MDH5292166.1 methyltransferase domain-containing protein [Acidimicrobiia bacterium]MDH5518920.1 methyltransferase domain-containing protein [Acidimicrobiia bacterium]